MLVIGAGKQQLQTDATLAHQILSSFGALLCDESQKLETAMFLNNVHMYLVPVLSLSKCAENFIR